MPHSLKLGFRTLDDLMKYYYGTIGDEFNKASGGFTTDTQGVYNPIFGAIAWANFNLEANVWSSIPKAPWNMSGWRIFTGKGDSIADAGTNNNTLEGGTVEGGLIADSVRPVVEEIFTKPKTVQYPFEVSEIMENLVRYSRDDLFGSLNQQRVIAADQTKELYNRMLTRATADLSDADDITSRLNFESLERIISSTVEFSENTPTATNAYNPWRGTANIDRSNAANTRYNSTVRSPTGDLSTADVITDPFVTKFLAAIRDASGKEPTYFIGGNDTYSEFQQVYNNGYRIVSESEVRGEFSAGVNGVQTFNGTNVGLHISMIYDLPLIQSKDMPISIRSNGTEIGDTSNVYVLNTRADKNSPMFPMLSMRVAKPILYYEASSRQQGYPFINGAFKDRALYETLEDTVCLNFVAQGKMMNLLSSSS